MGISVIGIAAVINVSLSVDLIAEAKIQQLHHADPNEKLGKRYLKWGIIVLSILILATWLGNYVIQKNRVADFKSFTAEAVESHQGNLERIFDYVNDTAQILKIREVLQTVNRSSDQISWTEAIMVKDVLGKESLLAFSAGTDSATLVSQSFENLILAPSTEEKQVLNELLSGEKSGIHVLESENGEILGYYPMKKGEKSMVIRVLQAKHSGSRR